MLPFDLARTSEQVVGALKPGQLFFHRHRGVVALAIRLHGRNAWWLNLTGNKAFQFGEDEDGQKKVLVPNISVESVKLRVDQSSCTADSSAHRIGQLLFEDGKAGIAAVWGDRDPEEYRNVMRLDDWSQSDMWQPRYIFDRWALSYLDESSQWVDLVRRELSGA